MMRIFTWFLLLSLICAVAYFAIYPAFKIKGVSDTDLKNRSGGLVSQSTKISFKVAKKAFNSLPKKAGIYKVNRQKTEEGAKNFAGRVSVGLNQVIKDDVIIFGNKPKKLGFNKNSGRVLFTNDSLAAKTGFGDSQGVLEIKAKEKLVSLNIAPNIKIVESFFSEKPQGLQPRKVSRNKAALFSVRFQRLLNGYPVLNQNSSASFAEFDTNFDLYYLDYYLMGDEIAQQEKELKNYKDVEKEVKSKNFTILYVDDAMAYLKIDFTKLEFKQINLNEVAFAYLVPGKDKDSLIPIYSLSGTAKNKAGNTIKITVYVPAQK